MDEPNKDAGTISQNAQPASSPSIESQMDSAIKKRSRRPILIGFALFAFLFGSLAGSLLCYQKVYADKIYYNVYAEGVELSGLTKKQARYALDKHYGTITEQSVILKAGEKEVTVKVGDTGLGYDVNKLVEEAYKIGRETSLQQKVLASSQTLWKKKLLTAPVTFNEEKYAAFVNLVIPQLNIESKDASLSITDGKVSESPEQDGQTVETANLRDTIKSLSANINQDAILIDVKKNEAATSTTDFAEAKQYAASLLAKKITFHYENFNFSPSANDIGKWITFKNDGGKITASLDESNIKAYLNSIASNFEIQKANRKVNALDNSVISEGKDGKLLNKDDALAKLKEMLKTSDQFTVELATTTQTMGEEKIFPAESLVPGRFPGKYIDVDLTQQRLCLFEGQTAGSCYIVSTGKPSTPTPTGTRIIDGKSPRQWSAAHGLWMPYWQSLGGGYGIHELPEWPSGYKEGEAHLGTPVSHGCIRLGVGPAETVYNWTENGTPVYIHK